MMRYLLRVLQVVISTAVAGAFFAPVSGYGDDKIAVGYVCDSEGDWLQNGVKIEPKKGAQVFADTSITLDPVYRKTNPGRGRIIVHLYNGQQIDRLAERKSDFEQPISIPRLTEESSGWSRFLKAAGVLFSHEPEKYVPAIARAADEPELTEAVVLLKGGKVDLAPVLQGVPPRKYQVRFLPPEGVVLSPGTVAPDQPSVEWKLRKTQLSVPGLTPGLWRVSLRESDDDSPYEGEAWVLVCGPEDYARKAKIFDSAAAWSDAKHPDAGRGGVRALLELLAHEK